MKVKVLRRMDNVSLRKTLVSSDYTQANFFFKLRKVVRYIRLYGVHKTLVKIQGQYHMRSAIGFNGPRWVNIGCKDPEVSARNVAIIGCGNFSFSHIAYYLRKYNSRFLRATFDIEKSRALSLCRVYGGAYAVEDWKEILSDSKVKIVFIASNHASHAEYAVACIEAGKHVHIEKPHVVSQKQLDQLIAAMRQHPHSKVFLGFNRPKGQLFSYLQEMLTGESGPVMINWFVAGHEIPEGHWYFDEREGGRVLGNLCHWTDLTLHLITMPKVFPCTIVPATPAGAKSDFVVSILFADRSCAAITFSAKRHTFEGVREILNLHKGDILANLADFHTLTVDVVEKKKKIRLRHRDHGHEANIVHSFMGAAENGGPGEAEMYVAATAKFFLAIREAIDSGEKVLLSWEDITRPLHEMGH
jgi:predicted dehydrogenase